MKVNEIKFRCSSLGHLMTDPREKSAKDAGELSETTKIHLVDVYVAKKYGRHSEMINKYVTKGLEVEEDSLTLYSRYKNRIFTKNTETLENDFIKGTPDVIKESVIDIKSSWDIFTFFRTEAKKLNKLYYWQLQGYMALTGANKSVLAYCLTDTPLVMVNDEKRKLLWKMGVSTDQNEEYILASDELERQLTYSDIPISERVIEIEIERNDHDIERLYQKIELCRDFLLTNFKW